MNPCRSSCPAGDCAGCAFPPAPRTRCVPEHGCVQRDRCQLAAIEPGPGVHTIDASGCLSGGPFCTLFLDRRAAALQVQPRPIHAHAIEL